MRSTITGENITFYPTIQHRSLCQITGKVVKTLLEVAADENSLYTLGKMALSLDTTPEMVNRALKALHENGAIKLEHRRIVINRELLLKIALGGNQAE